MNESSVLSCVIEDRLHKLVTYHDRFGIAVQGKLLQIRMIKVHLGLVPQRVQARERVQIAGIVGWPKRKPFAT